MPDRAPDRAPDTADECQLRPAPAGGLKRLPGLLGWLLLFALIAASWRGAQVDLKALFSPSAGVGNFVGGLWPPDLSGEFLAVVGKAMAETLALSIAGTLLAVLLGGPLALLAVGRIGRGTLDETRSTHDRRWRWILHSFARGVLNIFRAVPDFVWALVFVVMVGLGAVPGVLAIGIAYAGMLGKLYAEILEGMDSRPLEALQATGAGRLPVFLYGAIPLALPQLASFTLYAWECSMRAAALLGFVGAGGIGYQLDLSMRMFEFHQASTLLLALIALIGLVDGVSAIVRRTLGLGTDARRWTPKQRRFARRSLVLAGLTATVASFWLLFEPLRAALGDAGVGRLQRFAAGAWPPATEGSFLATALQAVWETLAISVIGTLVGVAIGVLLAFFAAHNRFVAPPAADRRRAWRQALYLGCRVILNALRAVPEVLWALIAVLAVGLGPFAGALALGVHTGGILGKLYADTFESTDGRPFEALIAGNAGRFVSLLYAIVPVSLPVLAAHTLYRWEMNLRAAAVLGLVGAGGIGQALYNTVQLGFHDQLLTLVLILYALVTAGDWLGGLIRRRLNT